jgi:tetratricopeptide (TPR) repeat protein
MRLAGISVLVIQPTPIIALADVLVEWDRDWVAANRQYERTLEQSPSDIWRHTEYAYSLIRMERSREAIQEATHGVEFDPISAQIYARLVFFYWSNHQYDQALEQQKEPGTGRGSWSHTMPSRAG